MPAIVYELPPARDQRLAALGLNRADLVEVVKACVAGRGGTTANDPKAAPGMMAWIYGTRRLREVLAPQGWRVAEEFGVEMVVHDGQRIGITVVATDKGTGDHDRSPKNRTPKGSATEKIVDLNSQLELFGTQTLGVSLLDGSARRMWELCVYDDGNEVRAELSLPSHFSSGFVLGFSERIFLIAGNDWNELHVDGEPDEGPEVVVEVRRK